MAEKVWEITRRMEDWPINLQIKDNVVHKIRPGIWYAEDTARTDYTVFESLEDFISAIEEAVFKILRHIIMLELGKLLFEKL